MAEKSAQARIVDRLRRVEGQVRGVTQMVEDDRYCIDILHQLQAVKSALARAEDEILKKHASHCVAEAIAIIKPTLITKAKLVDGFMKLQQTRLKRIIVCIITIQPRL